MEIKRFNLVIGVGPEFEKTWHFMFEDEKEVIDALSGIQEGTVYKLYEYGQETELGKEQATK